MSNAVAGPARNVVAASNTRRLHLFAMTVEHGHSGTRSLHAELAVRTNSSEPITRLGIAGTAHEASYLSLQAQDARTDGRARGRDEIGAVNAREDERENTRA